MKHLGIAEMCIQCTHRLSIALITGISVLLWYKPLKDHLLAYCLQSLAWQCSQQGTVYPGADHCCTASRQAGFLQNSLTLKPDHGRLTKFTLN